MPLNVYMSFPCRYVGAAIGNMSVGVDFSVVAAIVDMFTPEVTQNIEVIQHVHNTSCNVHVCTHVSNILLQYIQYVGLLVLWCM